MSDRIAIVSFSSPDCRYEGCVIILFSVMLMIDIKILSHHILNIVFMKYVNTSILSCHY